MEARIQALEAVVIDLLGIVKDIDFTTANLGSNDSAYGFSVKGPNRDELNSLTSSLFRVRDAETQKFIEDEGLTVKDDQK
jgi:hypothetical protein